MTLRQLNITGLLLASAFVLTACPRVRTSSPDATGGSNATGGAVLTGGAISSGGIVHTGGIVRSGGSIGTGGFVTTGGLVATGGLIPTGGIARTGGLIATGGSVETGGQNILIGCDIVVNDFHVEREAAQSCSTADECGQVITGTSCGCTRNLVARSDADLTELRRLMEQQVDGETCVQLFSTCDCPAADGFECNTGRCAWSYTAQEPDSCCVDSALSWGNIGGLVDPASIFSDSISGCDGFEREHAGTVCKTTIPECGSPEITGRAINGALSHPEVKKALTKGNVLYGIDARPVDGQVFQITFDGNVIQVGNDCAGAKDCVPIPAGVDALKTVLSALSSQQTCSDT